ncbi:uncharacterized protein [Physcomitrium patens]|uniref:Myb-like domain-containing protein n=1 Tax=Physcomitrium patens TaxID=3218 RepID=A0A2K1IVA5_PHYPA|nr:uncharacterized protein LOC112273067 [Physcomitrium patens]XP_024357183.1 uncharacterized protein LOC112273067 [Physcomitrium patens]PNR33215.1 hypothetical protein PHYPA_025158 [Physcomitrium patens]|eukprot:XP_024357182.1 uncharacterized protein LOC112273067 [Physcomitrella patens]
MAKQWSWQESIALVEEHIALRAKGSKGHTASEHWNEVAKRLREKGFNRSHESCNRRWYRLEQYRVQIISFNMQEDNHNNYWDLTREQRLECRSKWPQLPLGDGFDKKIFDCLESFSHQNEKKESVSNRMNVSPTSFEDKEVACTELNVELTRESVPLPAPPSAPSVSSTSTSAPSSHPLVAVDTVSPSAESKPQEESEKQVKTSWPVPSEQQPVSSQETFDGFKLQARELRRRRAAELRRNNRTVPYNSSHSTFVKTSQPPPHPTPENSSLITEPTTFDSIKVAPPPDFTNKTTENPNKIPSSMKPWFPFKRPNPFANACKMDDTQMPQNSPQQQPIGSHLNNSLSQNAIPGENYAKKPHHADQDTHKPVLQSVNSHLPLLHSGDSQMSNSGSKEELVQMIMGVHQGSFHNTNNCEQQLHKNLVVERVPLFHRGMNPGHQDNVEQCSPAVSLLGQTIGGLGAQLGTMVKLMQSKHAAEQEFRDKMLLFMECMVVSLHGMAQASARPNV